MTLKIQKNHYHLPLSVAVNEIMDEMQKKLVLQGLQLSTPRIARGYYLDYLSCHLMFF